MKDQAKEGRNFLSKVFQFPNKNSRIKGRRLEGIREIQCESRLCWTASRDGS